LLDMQGMHDETMGFKFSVEPFDSVAVGSHADLSENVLSSTCEICSIEDDLVVLEAELEVGPAVCALLFGLGVPVKMVHTIVH